MMKVWIVALLFACALSAGAIAATPESVNINTASATELASLDGIGQAKAEAIVAFREENGPFAHVDELVNVSGIGLATLERNRERLLVEPALASNQQP